MKAIAVSSNAPHPEDAVVDVAAQLQSRGANFSAEDCASLVFTSPHHAEDPEALSAALGDVFNDSPYIGWIGASAFHDAELSEGKPGLSVLHVSGVSAYARTVPQSGLGAYVAARLTADAPMGRSRFLSLSSEETDAFGMLLTLDEQPAPLAGAMGCRSPSGFSTSLGAEVKDEPFATLLTLDDCQMLLGVAQGTRQIGPPREVTKVDGQLVFELDGRPALEMLLRDLPPALRNNLPQLAGSLFAGLSSLDGSTFLTRNVMGLDPSTGAISVSADPAANSELVFALRDGNTARKELDLTLESMWDAMGPKSPIAVVGFTCLGRDEGMMGKPAYDISRIAEMFPDTPVVGASVNGEICTFGTNSNVFTYATVIAALLPED